MKSVHKVKLKQ